MQSPFACVYLSANDIMDPAATTSFMAESCKRVKFNREKLDSVVQLILKGVQEGACHQNYAANVLHTYNEVKLSFIKSLDRYFFVNCISFSFWKNPLSGGPKFMVKGPDGNVHKGSRAVMIRINQLIRCGIPFTASSLSCMPFEVFQFLMTDRRGAVLPMIEERWQIIRDAAATLDQKFAGHFYNCIKYANFNSAELLTLLLENFPRFRDITIYEGRKVSFLLRAQLLILGVAQLFKENNHKIGFMLDQEQLRISSSCRSVQMFRFYGLLVPSPEIEERMQKDDLFAYGEPDEVEMRAMSNYCVEEIKREVNRRLQLLGKPKITSVEVDAIVHKDRYERVSRLQRGQILFPKVRSALH
ncbi:hypothetical protein M514_11600 [Trichuris suis]|uniref:Queuosine 5'-phosphate N-glycosylase/hydrolase n=1 Tax=Trichuris suis TaxID=68888 RepID=A0A085NSA6_9BILA|nr:hypothetical protein M514_11600 [Trichuris suis]KHJ49271.1 hypothetical protein D918_00396 [Trichuris suis]